MYDVIVRVARGEPLSVLEQQRLADALRSTPKLRSDLEVQRHLSRGLGELRQAIERLEGPNDLASVFAAADNEAQAPLRPRRWIGFAAASGVAALLAVLLIGPMMFDFEGAESDREESPSVVRSIDSWPAYLDEFLPLRYDAGAPDRGMYTIVRVRIPLSTVSFVSDSAADDWTVEADVILGEDGLARGIRLVEAEIDVRED